MFSYFFVILKNTLLHVLESSFCPVQRLSLNWTCRDCWYFDYCRVSGVAAFSPESFAAVATFTLTSTFDIFDPAAGLSSSPLIMISIDFSDIWICNDRYKFEYRNPHFSRKTTNTNTRVFWKNCKFRAQGASPNSKFMQFLAISTIFFSNFGNIFGTNASNWFWFTKFAYKR